MKILIMDDEPEIVSILTAWLEKRGHTACAATSVSKLLKLAPSFDLVLLDLMMPWANGLSVISGIREVAPATRIVIISAIADMRVVVTASQEGAHFYLPKPIDFRQLDEIIDGIVERKPELRADPVPPRKSVAATVLLVEDEPELQEIVEYYLHSTGYIVITAADPEDALRLCRTHPEPIDLILTDVIMPQMSGRTLAEKALELRPRMQVLYISGYSGDVLSDHGVLEDGLNFLAKPFTAETLASKVREVLGRREVYA